MKYKTIKIASRDSALALVQAEIVKREILKSNSELDIEIVPMKTSGDKILDKPLDLVGGRGLFVKELDQALLDFQADLAVHSLKDMTMQDLPHMPVIAYTDREDPRDVLVLRKGLDKLPEKPVIGTSSKRRVLQAKELFPEADFKGIRGNINTRLKKLDEGQYDALIIAAAGLIRLGLEDRISKYFSVDEILPAACQGIMAVQGNIFNIKGFEETFRSFDINNKDSELIARTEREVVRRLGGGCSSPNCAYAELDDERIKITGLYYIENTGLVKKETISGSKDEADMLALRLAEKLVNGKVYLVGAGPGDPGLLTVKGKKLVEEADVIITDALLGDSLLSIIPRTGRVINAGKRKGRHSMTQEEINNLLVEEGKKGGIIVRLKGGDPFIFGRGGEEANVLKENGIPFEIVPGVTSAVAVPEYSGIPVTERGVARSFHIITAHTKGMTDDEPDFSYIDFEALKNLGGTICFLMGFSAVPVLAERLMDAGMDREMPCAVISQGTTASHKTLISKLCKVKEDLMSSLLTAPAIFLVGEVCALCDRCSWMEAMPLSGKRIVVTRPEKQSEYMVETLRALGAEVLNDPAIRLQRYTKGTSQYEVLKDKLNHIEDYRWLGLTSPSGVDMLFEYLQEFRIDVRRLYHLKVAVVGEATAKAFEKRNIYADLIPDFYYTRDLAYKLADNMKSGEKLLTLRASNASSELTDILRECGINFDDVVLYETLQEKNTYLTERIKEHMEEGDIDYCLFASSYTVECFDKKMMLTDDEKKNFIAVCIGKRTAEKAKELGYNTVISDVQTANGMVELVVKLSN